MTLEKHAKLVDCIDAVTGPLSSACMLSGSEHLYSLGILISVTELAFLKLPFIARYVIKEKSLMPLIFWVPKEIMANSYVWGGFADIAPTYHIGVKYFSER